MVDFDFEIITKELIRYWRKNKWDSPDIKIPTKKLVRKWREQVRDAPVWGMAVFFPQSSIFLFWKKSAQKVFIMQSEKAFATLLGLLEHEILHHVLDKVSFKARHQFDNIYNPACDSLIDLIS